MTLETINHSTKAVSRITDDLKKENFEKFVTVYTEEIQELETALIELAEQKNINTITGIWLDFLGKIIGETRNGRGDEPYRSALRIRILVNSADATPNNMISTVSQYTNSTSVRLSEGSIAFGTIFFNGQSNADNTLVSLVDQIKPVATKWIIESDIDNNALDMAWEDIVQNNTLGNINAECGDFQVECGEPGAECGDSILKSVGTFTIGFYPPSVNSKNLFAWEDSITVIDISCGELGAQCGEQGAECGNTKIETTIDVVRPLRWEVTEDTLVQ